MKIEKINRIKISSYSVMAVAFISSANNMQGQVDYNDINPDEVLNTDGQFFEIDMNDDDNADFRIFVADYFVPSIFSSSSGGVFDGGVKGVFVVPMDGAGIVGYGLGSIAYPYAISNAQAINSDLSFMTAALQPLINYQVVYDYPTPGSNYVILSYGYWNGAVDKFIGVRIEAGGNTHYGYIRLDVSNDHHQATIKDYALNLTPDEEIITGDMCIFIDNSLTEDQLSVFSFGNTIHLEIFDNQILQAEVRIMDLEGQSVYFDVLNSNKNAIELNNVFSGIYIVQVITQDQSSYNTTVFIQN